MILDSKGDNDNQNEGLVWFGLVWFGFMAHQPLYVI